MRAVVQRVSSARVLVDGQPVGAIGVGLLVLLILSLPFLLMEVEQRRLRKLHDNLRPARAQRYNVSARAAAVVALIWFAAWLTLGI